MFILLSVPNYCHLVHASSLRIQDYVCLEHYTWLRRGLPGLITEWGKILKLCCNVVSLRSHYFVSKIRKMLMNRLKRPSHGLACWNTLSAMDGEEHGACYTIDNWILLTESTSCSLLLTNLLNYCIWQHISSWSVLRFANSRNLSAKKTTKTFIQISKM